MCISRAQLQLACFSANWRLCPNANLTFTSKNSQVQLIASSCPLVSPTKLLYSCDSNPRNGNNGYRDANFPRQLCGRLRKLKSVGVADRPGVLGRKEELLHCAEID